ncbi:Glutamyl-tRNA(Gln) amidotransferase subunit A [Coccomyxa sp. Obi]|nr:Glutamyl-tRNA(Gln) amidotransferase subunit A [Coccomyxa sp. Obi]
MLSIGGDQAAAGEAKWMSGVPASVLDGVPLAVKGNFLLKDVAMNTARTQLLRDHLPTHCASLGRLSRQGLLSVAGEWETPGVLARTVSDAALLLAILQGKDAGGCKKIGNLLDQTKKDIDKVQRALPSLLGFPEGDRPLQGLRVGVVELSTSGFLPRDAQAEVLKQGTSYLEQAGAAVEDVQLPDLQQGVGAMYYFATGHLLRGRSSFERELKELGFGHANTNEEVRSILLATRRRGLELSGQPDMCDEVAACSARNFADSLKQVDVLLLPSAPCAPPTVAEASEWGNEHFLSIDAINVTASLAGAPAMNVPVALTSKGGLPLGVQVVAAPSQEARVLAVGHVLERGAQSGFKAGSLLAPLHSPDKGKAPISTV